MSARVDALFAAWNRADTPGCALAIVRDGKIVYEKGYGSANLEYGVPIRPTTIFHVASVSKQFTAMCVHLLAQEGKLALDEDVRKYLPELHDFGKTITIWHLLHHTSGLRDQWNLLTLAGWRMDDVITEQDILRLVWRQRELNFAPGAEELYCNTGYTLLGLIVKRVSGKSLRNFAQERIFQPLGMTATHFHDDHQEIVKNRAASYFPGRGGYRNAVLSFANVGATSLFTTVEDLARWDANFYDGRVGGAKVLEEMLRKGRLNGGVEINYASALQHGRYKGLPTVSHNGADAGFRSVLLRFPEQKFTVIILANAPVFDPSQQSLRVADICLEDALKNGKPVAHRETVSASEAPEVQMAMTDKQKDEYVGEYYSEELDVFYRVVLRDGQILLQHRRGEGTLTPILVDGFRSPLGTVTFQRDAKQRIEGFRVTSGRVRNLLFRRDYGEIFTRP
jgi:CubicO group peptidase (beta-lactamase class C family)